MEGAEMIRSSYGDPRLRTKGLNPYERYPERSEWTEFEVWRKPDGTEVRRERRMSRWGGEFSYGEWRKIQSAE